MDQIDTDGIVRGSGTGWYQLGANHARAFVYPTPPASPQGKWLYMNGYRDTATAAGSLPNEKNYCAGKRV